MINKQYYNNFLKLNVNLDEINKKQFDDFMKIFTKDPSSKLNDQQVDELLDVVLKTTAFNGRKTVNISDLFAILESDVFDSPVLQNNFNSVMQELMFAEELANVDKIKEVKFENVKPSQDDKLSDLQIKHLHEIISWANSYMNDLQKNKVNVLQSGDFKNKLTSTAMKNFYETNLEHIQSMLRWHKLGCETILGE